ncbi:MAG: transglycosylase domain-containing protein [Chitinophagaceae bacterium]|nr:transglycosylase domain-containing protein [Chitinophagaceae bacterium]
MSKSKNKKNNNSSVKPAVKILWRLVFTGIGLVVILFGGAYVGLFGRLPSLQQLENPEADLATEIYANDGKTLMGKIYAENRVSVDYKDIAPGVIEALISTEDERFYNHSGVDPRSTARAFWGLGSSGGGSTITQQLAKNILGQGRGNMLKRGIDKVKEWIVAIKLERNFTKQEIIALYLNRVSWLNVYGIRNASLVYFQKEPADLTIDESALLVGMLKGPGAYNPVTRPENALNRRNVVLDQMVRNKMLTTAEATELKKKPLGIKYKKISEDVGIAPYFRSELTKKLLDWCKNNKNPKTGENYDLYRDGLKIYTTIDPDMQKYAEQAIIKHMTAMQKSYNRLKRKNVWKGRENIIERAIRESDRWRSLKEEGLSDDSARAVFNHPVKMKIFAWNAKRETDTLMTPVDSIKYLKQMMQSAFLAMDPVSGEIKAWVGGIDFKWFKYDHVTANRQVGSTFKPLLYTLAITDAGLTPESYLGGKTITLNNKTISGEGGTMAYCLAKSINVAAYDLMERIGPAKTVEFAHELGIKSDIPAVPSIALGSADIQLIEMLRSYTMFPNKGFNTEPIMINRIEDKNGNVLETFQPKIKQVISESDAYTMYRMMQGVMDFGTGGSMRWRFGINSAMGGKTGTTNDNTDGWFIGYTPQLLAGAWVGFDDPFLKLTGAGNTMALPEFGYFMQKVYANKELGIDPNAEFDMPAQLHNDPIFADRNFTNILMQGTGDDSDEYMNGDAGDYEPTYVPIESDFDEYKPVEKKPTRPEVKPAKKDSTGKVKQEPAEQDSRKPKAVMPKKDNKKSEQEGN